MSEKKFIYEKRKSTGKYVKPEKHYHKFFELYYLKKGRCKYFIDNKIFEVKENDIIIIPDGIIHNTTYYLPEKHERILLQFNKEYINPILISKLQGFFKKRIYRPENFSFIETILDKIGVEYENKSDISDELIKCYMTELFSYIIRNESLIIDDNSNTKENALISEITEYISENFSQEFTLDDISEKAGFSKYYFSKFFKASTGFGYKEFVLITRLREAKKLLSQTDLSVCEIAFQCGFNDSNYFSNIFKKKEGLSPLSYRKNKYAKNS